MCGGMLGQSSRAESSDTRRTIVLGTILEKVRRCAHAPKLREHQVVLVYDDELLGVPAKQERQLGLLFARGA